MADLHADLTALADEWDEAADKWPYAVWHDNQKALVHDLRALLASRTTSRGAF